jgi:AcrR family transcriptional regulator
MRRRAEQVDETRERITEATVRLHTTVGPAHTSIAAVAQEAGVTRLTVYRHFADLDALFVACRAHWVAQNPRPDPGAWLAIPDLEDRVRRAFGELYGWYRDHADELYPIYRDAGAMPLSAQRATAEGNRLLADSLLAGHAGIDPDGDGRLVHAVARHLVDFWTWRSLAIQQDLDDRAAVTTAVRLMMAMIDDGTRNRPGSPTRSVGRREAGRPAHAPDDE